MGRTCLPLSAPAWKPQISGVKLTVLPQTFGHRDGDEGTNQRGASLEPDLAGEFLSVFLRHIAEKRMDKRVREVGDAGKIENDRLHPIPDAFDPERTEFIPQVPIGEEFAEFGYHVDFQFHVFVSLRGKDFRSFLRLCVGDYPRISARPQSKFDPAQSTNIPSAWISFMPISAIALACMAA